MGQGERERERNRERGRKRVEDGERGREKKVRLAKGALFPFVISQVKANYSLNARTKCNEKSAYWQ